MGKGSRKRSPEHKVAPHGLCSSCRHGIVREHDNGHHTVRCYIFEQRITTPVRKCTGYTERHSMDRHEMEQIAWIIDKDKRQAGFIIHMPGSSGHKRLIDE